MKFWSSPIRSGEKPTMPGGKGVEVEAVKTISLRAFHPDSTLPYPPHKSVEEIFDTFQPEIVHIQDHYQPQPRGGIDCPKARHKNSWNQSFHA